MTGPARRDSARAEPLAQVRAYVETARGGAASFSEVAELAELAASSMEAFLHTVDRSLMRELKEIAAYITAMKAEISELRAGEMKAERLPSAGARLGQVVVATEDATNAIMAAAEDMLAGQDQDDADFKALVTDKVMAIFEACAFQDITGQHISRVIETLDHIEDRIGRFAEAIGPGEASAAAAAYDDQKVERATELMLNGPQAKGVAIAQADVDALMAAPFDGKPQGGRKGG